MQKNQTLLDKEALEILSEAKDYQFPDFELRIHTPEKIITVNMLGNIVVERDYQKNITDIIKIEFAMLVGTYRDDIEAYKHKLECVLTMNNKQMAYKLVIESTNRNEYDNLYNKMTREELDTQDLFIVKAQLVDPMLLSFKDGYISGVYHDMTVLELVRYIFAKRLGEIKVSGKKLIYRYHASKTGCNDKTYDNIIIPAFTKILKLPHVLQEEGYGIYRSGLNIYFTQWGHGDGYDVYVYPPYELERHTEDDGLPKFMMVNPMSDRMEFNTQDFGYKEMKWKCIVGKVDFDDKTDKNKYKVPTGLIYGDPNKMYLDRTVTEDKVSHTPYHTIVDVREMQDYSHYIYLDMDDNIWRYQSELSKSAGIVGVIDMEKVSAEVIYPGIGFEYKFNKGKDVVTTTGVVMRADMVWEFDKKNMGAKFICMFKKVKEK